MKDRIIDTLTLQQYLEGTLDTHTRHELEKQALEDNFLADALEGYTYVIEPAEKLSLLQKRLSDRVLVHEANKKAFSVSAQRLSIAAAAGLMFFLAVILFWMNGYKKQRTSKEVQVELSSLNPSGGVKQAESIAKSIVSPIILLSEGGTSSSAPAVGWDAYRTYIQKSLTGRKTLTDLVISFKINNAGRPFGLKLIKGSVDDHSRKVIQIIKDGPEWMPSDNRNIKLHVRSGK